jgi:hypothetical protein
VGAAGITRPVSRSWLLLLGALILAGCGGGGSAGGTTPGQGGGNGDGGSRAQNPRVRAVLGCFDSAGGELSTAYELESNAIALNTEANGVELHFLTTAARAKKLGHEIEATGIGEVFIKDTVVENWSSPPTPDERDPVAKCLEDDPGP